MADSEGRDAREVIGEDFLDVVVDAVRDCESGYYQQVHPPAAAVSVRDAIFSAAGVEGPGTAALVRGEDGAVTIKRAARWGHLISEWRGARCKADCGGDDLYRLVDGEPS